MADKRGNKQKGREEAGFRTRGTGRGRQKQDWILLLAI
jgi:hypothetical protein